MSAMQAIAADVGGGRTAKQAHQRWTRRGVGMTNRKTGRWSAEEDHTLVQVQPTATGSCLCQAFTAQLQLRERCTANRSALFLAVRRCSTSQCSASNPCNHDLIHRLSGVHAPGRFRRVHDHCSAPDYLGDCRAWSCMARAGLWWHRAWRAALTCSAASATPSTWTPAWSRASSPQVQ